MKTTAVKSVKAFIILTFIIFFGAVVYSGIGKNNRDGQQEAVSKPVCKSDCNECSSEDVSSQFVVFRIMQLL